MVCLYFFINSFDSDTRPTSYTKILNCLDTTHRKVLEVFGDTHRQHWRWTDTSETTI